MDAAGGRRRFLALAGGSCAACLLAPGGGSATGTAAAPILAQDQAGPDPLLPGRPAPAAARPARWWKKKEGLTVECGLCPRHCVVADIERGTCGVRENRKGQYVTLVHSNPCSLNLDPIEKKPFFHVLPGTLSLSLATPGCNLECRFCQNWEIAQARPEQIGSIPLAPEDAVRLARLKKAPTIACTYTEPVVFAEYMRDIAAAGRGQQVRTVMVSNGYVEAEPLDDLCDVLAAVKIDLKAFSDTFYRNQCNGELKPVLETLRRLRRRKIWTEIVVLLIPTLNDGDEEIRALARFVRNDLGPEVPLHFSRFHPSYRLTNLPPTPVATLERAHRICRDEGLQYVYIGNVPGHPAESTWCPGCGAAVIRRTGFAVIANTLRDGRCPACGRSIPGIWS